MLALVFVVCGGPLRADSFEDGLTAFRAGEPGRAHDIWLPLAGEGDAAAQYSLGKLFEHGEGPIPQDLTKAVYWYRSAAKQGLPAAQNNLALMYAQGRGVPGDLNSAIELWRSAAEQNYPWAQYNLGLAFFRGQGVAVDQNEAARWFRRAADGGLAEAQFIMGQLRREGLGLEKDEGRALAWYYRAADQGHLRARKQANALRAAGVEPKPPTTAESAEPAVQELAARLPKPSASVSEIGAEAGNEPQGEGPAAPGPSSTSAVKAETKAEPRVKAPVKRQPAKTPGPTKADPPAETPTAAAQQTGATEATPESRASPQTGTAKSSPAVPPDPGAQRPKAEAPAKAGGAAGRPPESAATQTAALPADGDGRSNPGSGSGFRVWLASAGNKAQATKLWQQVRDRHPEVLSGAEVGYGQVDLGGQTLFRVLVGPLASAAEAEQLCARLRVADPGAFCKVRAD